MSKKSFFLTLTKFLTFLGFHFDLKFVADFSLDIDFMLIEENACLYFLFFSEAILVNLVQYRASVGVFNNRDNISTIKNLNYPTIFSVTHICQKLHDFIYLFYFFYETYRWTSLFGNKCIVFLYYNNMPTFSWYHKRWLILSNDNEVNPGPKIPLRISQYVIGTWTV